MNCELKKLLQELIDKDVSLEKSANILWQWKVWEEAKDEERYGIARNAGQDAMAHLHKVAEMHRLQLEHYMVVGRISQDLINRLIRPDKLKIEN